MPDRAILFSYPISVLRREIRLANKALNIIKMSAGGKSKTKTELIDDMLIHKERFHHIKKKYVKGITTGGILTKAELAKRQKARAKLEAKAAKDAAKSSKSK